MTHNVTSEQEKGLTAKQRQAAQLLAEGSTAVQAAERVGVARGTLERWKNIAEFQASVVQVENAIYEDSLRLLKKTARGAISCLIRNMDVKISPYVQVAAASKLLDLGIQVHKVAELEAEIAELRQLVGRADDDDLAS